MTYAYIVLFAGFGAYWPLPHPGEFESKIVTSVVVPEEYLKILIDEKSTPVGIANSIKTPPKNVAVVVISKAVIESLR